MMRPDPGTRSDLIGDVRLRLPLPFVIPVASALVIAVFAVGFSRVLLAVPKEAATVLALVMAANVLGACIVLALRPPRNRSGLAELLMVVAYPLLIGIVIAQVGIGSETATSAGERTTGAESASGGLNVTAANIQFDVDELALPAGEATTIGLQNEDTQPHNISIYEEQGGATLFEGEIIDGGESTEYEVPALEEGEYYFQCDLHPGMNGTVVAGQEAAPGLTGDEEGAPESGSEDGS